MISVERILQDPPAKAHMQEQRTIQLIRSIDRLDLQARRRRVKGERGMNLSLLSDAIEYRRKNATLLHRHHQNPTFSATSASAIKNHVRMICIRMLHKPISPSPSRTRHTTDPHAAPRTSTRSPTPTHEPIRIKVANPPNGRKAILPHAIGATYRLSFQGCSRNRV